MNKRDLAVSRGRTHNSFRLDGRCPPERIRHETGWLDEREGNSARSDGGFALRVPYAGPDVLLRIHRREFDEMLHAGSLRGMRCGLITERQLLATVEKEKSIDPLQGSQQGT